MTAKDKDLFSEPSEKRLYLLDGMALVYRAHFALIRAPRFTSGGVCTSAVFGLTNTILDIIQREQPSHLAVAFDTSEPTQRHIEFPEYKAQRDEMPEDISAQLPLVDRLLDAFNIPVIRTPGYEADDIIGTLAHQAAPQGFRTWMVTPDKDYDQLVTDDIFVYKPGRKGGDSEIAGVPEVLEKWGIERVDQVIDILGLMGDSSDNIPGVPGVGPKTAQKLIAQFGSIEELLKHTDSLKGKQKERIEENAKMALLSKKLVTIQLDVPHDFRIESFKCQAYDKEKLTSLFGDLEFETLGKKLFGKSFSTASSKAKVIREKRESEIQATLFDEPVEEKTIADVEHDYVTIQSPAERKKLIKQLKQLSQFCFDTETTGLDPRTAIPLGIAFCYENHKAYYVVCPDDPQAAIAVLEEFRELFEDESIAKIGHNLKYDISLLKWQGIEVRGELFDTMLAHSMKEPEMRHGLDYLSTLYLGYKPIPTSALIGPKGDDQMNMRDVEVEKLAEYAAEDADVTWQVAEAIRPDIETRGVSKVCYEIECPLVPVLVDMEYHGVRLDTEALSVFSEKLSVEIDQLQTQIFEAAGHEFNIDSPKQLGVVLYEELELEKNPKKTATGQYSTREAELLRLAPKHQIISDVLDYRNARKLKSVYVDQLPEWLNPNDRAITYALQPGLDRNRTNPVGRSKPANDSDPERAWSRHSRGFCAQRRRSLAAKCRLFADRTRVMAELCGDESMMQAFIDGDDIHTTTASKVYKVDPADVTREMRDKAKTVNFGIIYGISAFGLQQRLNIPRGEASD